MSSGGMWSTREPSLSARDLRDSLPSLSDIPNPAPENIRTTAPLYPAEAMQAAVQKALLMVAGGLGLNPTQLAAAVVSNPEGAADVFDGAGMPTPDAAAAAESGLGEALIGSEGHHYDEDPTATPPQPGLSSPMVPSPTIDLVPGQDPGVVAAGNAPPEGAPDLAKILSGVQAPAPPQAPQLGTPGVPSPRSIEGPTLDELIRGALGVAAPSTNAITLANTVGRR